MRFPVQIICIAICIPFLACTETEKPIPASGTDYQPLKIGLFWKYKVSENLIFGENDNESGTFFYRDQIESTYKNAENEEVYVLTRSKSLDGADWEVQGNYALLLRERTLIRFIENQNTVNLVFPPSLGLNWDSNIYSAKEADEFKIDLLGSYNLDEQEFPRSLKVLQEEADDEITFRDNRYMVFAEGIGMIEEYYEVYTYCSRNDCLGQLIIDTGRLTHLKIVEYGQN